MSNAHFTSNRELRARQTAEYRARISERASRDLLSRKPRDRRTTDPGNGAMTSEATRDILAARYVARIRNKRKREYASAYLAFLRQESTIAPLHNGLSFMAAQAVESRLRAILRGDETV